MKIRKATIGDIEQLSKLFDGYRVWYRKESDLQGAKVFLSERLERADSVIFVCEDNELAGFTQLYPLFSSTRMKKYWLLNDLYVSDNYRGKGISIKLIDKAKELVVETGACGMFLETEKSNIVGNKLYPRVGFQLNEIANYYEWSPE